MEMIPAPQLSQSSTPRRRRQTNGVELTTPVVLTRQQGVNEEIMKLTLEFQKQLVDKFKAGEIKPSTVKFRFVGKKV